MNPLEKAALLAFAAFVKANESGFVTDLGPVNLVIENDAVKYADEAANALPAFVKASADAFINIYGPQVAPLLAKEEAFGFAELATAAESLANS